MMEADQKQREEEARKRRLGALHKGPCSSPYSKEDHCPCRNDCPLHGRCCDCVHLHLKMRMKKGEQGVPAEDTNWMVACMKLAQAGDFGRLYIHEEKPE